MPETSPKRLAPLFTELRDYGQDVANATYQSVDDAMRRYYSLLRPDQPIGALIRELLPPVDFDEWHAEISKGGGSMVGSHSLGWPDGAAARVAMQLELVRRIAEDEMELLAFAHQFTYSSGNLNDNIRSFVEQVFLPFHRDLCRLALPALEAEEAAADAERPKGREPLPHAFISPSRISELSGLSGASFDLRKLLEICKELDFCFRNDQVIAVAALTRALLDHVPPIFGHKSFAEVASNYSGGRSFRETMEQLEKSARNIGDGHLHSPIRARETLPTLVQVNFSQAIDVLLREIVRILGSTGGTSVGR